MWITTQQSTATSYGTAYEFPALGYNSGNTGALHAGSFVDSNDTAFFLDPNGTSNLSITRTYIGARDTNGNWATGFQNTPAFTKAYHGDISSGGPAGTWWFYESMRHSNASNFWGTQIAWGWEDNSNRLFQRNVSGNSFSGWVEYLNTGGRVFSGDLIMSSSMRSPIFYNYTDTNYYVDPNSNSVLYSFDNINQRCSYSRQWDNYPGISVYNTTDQGPQGDFRIFGSAGANGGDFSVRLLVDGDITTLNSLNAGIAAYSPIYYDSNNTAYVVNPNGGSRTRNIEVAAGHGDTQIRLTALQAEMGSGIQSAMTWWLSEPGVSWNEGGFGFNVTNDGGTPGGFGRLNTSYGQGYARYLTSGNIIFYNTNTSGARSTTMQLYPGSIVESYGDFRAPIFYDSNDTAYRIDPTDVSRIVLIRADHYGRAAHNTGFLRGGYNNIGASEGQTSPIYCIGSSYEPAATTLSNMYGIGFTAGGSFMPSGASDWGMYVAAAGVARIFLSGGNGEITATGNITAYASDRRLKTNITPITNALDKVMQINGVEFDWVDNIEELGFQPQTMHETGVIAQEIQAVIPDAVKTAPFNKNATDIAGFDSDYLTVDKEKIVPLLIEAIKEQQAHINRLEEKINLMLDNK
jgi:hypothetical protein